MARFLVLGLALWGSAAYGLDQYTLETVRYDVVAPPGSKNVRLFWEGQIKNNTSQDATVLPAVFLLDENKRVICEFKLPGVAVPRFGKETRKEVLLVDPDLWKRTAAIEGRAKPDEKEIARDEPEVDLYCDSDYIGCREARDFLRRHRITFVEYDVNSNREAVRRLTKDLKLELRWPTLIVNGKPFVGYSDRLYEEVFGIEQ